MFLWSYPLQTRLSHESDVGVLCVEVASRDNILAMVCAFHTGYSSRFDVSATSKKYKSWGIEFFMNFCGTKALAHQVRKEAWMYGLRRWGHAYQGGIRKITKERNIPQARMIAASTSTMADTRNNEHPDWKGESWDTKQHSRIIAFYCHIVSRRIFRVETNIMGDQGDSWARWTFSSERN